MFTCPHRTYGPVKNTDISDWKRYKIENYFKCFSKDEWWLFQVLRGFFCWQSNFWVEIERMIKNYLGRGRGEVEYSYHGEQQTHEVSWWKPEDQCDLESRVWAAVRQGCKDGRAQAGHVCWLSEQFWSLVYEQQETIEGFVAGKPLALVLFCKCHSGAIWEKIR